MSEAKAYRARNLRYKRPALASLGYDSLITELWEIREACSDIHWFIDDGDETLLNALNGDEDEEWEFRMAFSDLEAKADQLDDMLNEWRSWDEDEFGRTYNDCTVALIGNQYKTIGYDMYEEDCPCAPSHIGCTLSSCGKDRPGYGQSQHPYLCFPL